MLQKLRQYWQFILFALGLALYLSVRFLPDIQKGLTPLEMGQLLQQAESKFTLKDYLGAHDILAPHVDKIASRPEFSRRPLYVFTVSGDKVFGLKDQYHLARLRPRLETLYRRLVAARDGSVVFAPQVEKQMVIDVLDMLHRIAMNKGDVNTAIRLFQEKVILFPGQFLDYHHRIVSLMQLPEVNRIEDAAAQMLAYLAEVRRYAEPNKRMRMDFEGRLALGEIWMNAGRFPEAIEVFREIESLYPELEGLERVYLNLGDIAIKEGRQQDALYLYDRATSYPYLNLTIMEAQFRKAEVLRMTEKYLEAAEAFQSLLTPKMDRKLYFSALIQMGDALYAGGEQVRAIQLYKEAVEMLRGDLSYFDPRFVEFNDFIRRLGSAISSSKLSDTVTFQLGVDTMRLLCEACPDNQNVICRPRLAALYSEFAERLRRQFIVGGTIGRDADLNNVAAGDEYKKILELPVSIVEKREAMWQAGVNYYRGNYYPAAIEMLQRYKDYPSKEAIKIQADFFIGKALRAMGDNNKAIKIFAAINRDNPHQVQAYQSMLEIAKSYEEAFRFDMATTYYNRIFNDYFDYNENKIRESRITPDSQVWRDAEFNLGRLYFRRGMLPEAKNTLATFLDRYQPAQGEVATDDYHYANFYLGMTFFTLGDFDKAIPYFEYITFLGDEFIMRGGGFYHLNSLFLIGDCRYQQGLFTEAIEAYEKALNKHGRNIEAAWAHYQIGNAYNRLGSKAEMKRAYSQALFLFPNLDDSQFQDYPAGLRKQYWEELFKWVETIR
ncbi:tetratricopeptide repeat protein [Planctomycetota bacterium]